MGNSSHVSVPSVSSEPNFKGYVQSANWGNPTVAGGSLAVRTDTLRSVASELGAMAQQLEGALGEWQSAASAAHSSVGTWTAAGSLSGVVGKAYSGVQQFTSDLQKAHTDMQRRLTISADRYDTNEQDLAALARKANDADATVIGAGGNNTPVNPTPAQARVLDIEHHMGGMQENWQQVFPITEDASYDQGSTSGITLQQVQDYLDATDPATVTAAGSGYTKLYSTLTDIAGKLANQGAQLSSDWQGTTAVTAISQVQQLWQTASDMQANTYTAGAALTYYGGVLDAYKSAVPQASTGGSAAAKKSADDEAAQQYMNSLNGHVSTAFYNMPGAVNKNLPASLTSTGGSIGSGGVGSNGAGAAAPAVTGGGGVGSVPGVTTPGVGSHPGGVDTLSGSGPGGVGTISPPGTGTTGGTGPVGIGTPPVGGGGGGTVGVMPPPVGGGGGGSGDPDPVGVGGVGGSGDPDPVGGIGGVGGVGGSGDPDPVGGIGGVGGVGGSGDPDPVGGIGGVGGVGGSGDPDPVGGIGGLGDPGGVGGVGGVSGVGDPGGTPYPGGIGGMGGAGGGGGAGDVGDVGGVSPLSGTGDPGDLAGIEPGTPGIGPDGVITGQGLPDSMLGAPGDDLAGSGAGVMGGDGVGMPMMGMPGGAGGGMGDGIGRTRESWATEDEDGPWASDGMAGAADGADAATDGMFPGMMPMGASGNKDRDRNRQSWMAEEDDLWGIGQAAAPPVISPN
jgi:Excreted virulence factor EspC, type VII ESX diderm